MVDFCQTNEEKNFAIAFSGNRIDSDKETISSLIDCLAKWRFMTGVSSKSHEDEIATELIMIAKFISENYGKLTIQEIELAFNLCLTHKLDIDPKPYNSFSPLYVSTVLNAYMEYRRPIYNDIYERKERKDLEYLEFSSEPNPEQKANDMKEMIMYFYEKHLNQEEIDDVFGMVYGFLKRTNRMKMPKEEIDNALIYGGNKASDFILKTYTRPKEKKPDYENVKKRFARNYCLKKFFEINDVNAVISSIQNTEFI